MTKSINKILLVLVLVFIGNLSPSKVNANSYPLGITNTYGQAISMQVDMYNDEAQSSSTPTHALSQLGVALWLTDTSGDPNFNSMNAQIYDGASSLGSAINYDINTSTTYYPNGNFYDPFFSPKFNNGHNIMKFVGPGPLTNTAMRTYDILVNYRFFNVSHSIRIPFYSFFPKVDVKAFNMTTGSPVEIPKNASNVTTSAVTPGTPIRLTWSAVGNNPGAYCNVPPNNTSAGVDVFSGTYPTSGTIPAASVSTLYPITCIYKQFQNVTTSKLSNVTRYSVDVDIDISGTSGLPTEVGVVFATTDWGPDYPYITPDGYGVKVIATNPGATYHFSTTLSGSTVGFTNAGSGSYAPYPLCYWEGTHYYIRGYVKNNLGTTYGNTREIILKGYGC